MLVSVFTSSVFSSLQVDSFVSYLVALLLPALDAIFPGKIRHLGDGEGLIVHGA